MSESISSSIISYLPYFISLYHWYLLYQGIFYYNREASVAEWIKRSASARVARVQIPVATKSNRSCVLVVIYHATLNHEIFTYTIGKRHRYGVNREPDVKLMFEFFLSLNYTRRSEERWRHYVKRMNERIK